MPQKLLRVFLGSPFGREKTIFAAPLSALCRLPKMKIRLIDRLYHAPQRRMLMKTALIPIAV